MDLQLTASDEDLFPPSQPVSAPAPSRRAHRLRSVVSIPATPGSTPGSTHSSSRAGRPHQRTPRSQRSRRSSPPSPTPPGRARRSGRPASLAGPAPPSPAEPLSSVQPLPSTSIPVPPQSAALAAPFTGAPCSSFSLSTAPPVAPPANARMFNPPLVSSSLRNRILQGADVDLSSLLLPSPSSAPRVIDTGDISLTLHQPGPRVSKILSAAEFAFAFSIFRDVICSAFPSRRQELDDYLSLILDMAIRFGGSGFYEYHRLFSARAAARLTQWNLATFWGAPDLELYCHVFAGRSSLSCSACGGPSHPASVCSQAASTAPPAPVQHSSARAAPVRPSSSGARDSFGRPIVFLDGQMLLRFLSTPVNVPALAADLSAHPDTSFVCSLLDGFLFGFYPGLVASPSSSLTCPNLLSALAEPDVVSSLLQQELSSGFIIGPFSTPPFSVFRINPLGIATRKYSGKKRIIIDLSAPHGSSDPSINSLIPSSEFSLRYATVDCAIEAIKLAGRGAWLSKADIISAFKILPLHPDSWHLFGVRWDDQFYFSVRLAFGCKSSPKLFDSFAEALCWILLNKHRLPFVLHLLDDFLVVDSPSSPPSRGLDAVTSTFTRLGVPISEEKTVGPATSLEFLGIILDSASFQASLPQEKLNRVTSFISDFLSFPTRTKQQLLSLLGHFNYATQIIPQGRSFISHLLRLSSSVRSLHHFVTLDEYCTSELRFWLSLLRHWNGISFFYADAASSPSDVQLFTDAAPSSGFGGYYGGRWFASAWPKQFVRSAAHLRDSSALWEIYPIVVAALLWGHEWSGKSILLHSDNLAAVHIINKSRSKSLEIMPFIRRLTWHSIKHQFIIKAVHIPGFI
ncbi:uncharacterized protein LOC125804934 [Astyanax mexicanus]|uniref:uncharacterized protein LOC125804934 n=1 Tax=Astyanax mexicanus TaxID=7994 RepID=UPI0020CAE656|nr:uncharacterized protein LOC125804934 [Astyanax mexicanus]